MTRHQSLVLAHLSPCPTLAHFVWRINYENNLTAQIGKENRIELVCKKGVCHRRSDHRENTEVTLPPRPSVHSVVNPWLLPACRRNNAVHAQVFHHLSVFIGVMDYRACCYIETGCGAAEEGKLFRRVFRSQGLGGAMPHRK